jgi:FlaA1/EpsC-like NDP-sugar epimerase
MGFFLKKNFWIMLLSDIVLLCFCYVSAYWLRFEGSIGPASVDLIVCTIPVLLICKIVCFYFADLYRGMWRYTGIMDLLNVIKGSMAATLFFTLYIAMVYHFSGVSRSIILLDFIFTIVASGGLRLFIRLYYQRQPEFLEEIIFWRKHKSDNKRVLIIGTGPLAERLFREFQGSLQDSFRVIGFIDEVHAHRGMKIHGVPVLGSLSDIPDMVFHYRIDDILIANPDFGPVKIKALVESCTGLGARVKVVPSLSERINGAVAHHLRDIMIEDLLDREPIHIDMLEVSKDINGCDILITGAGGSIGSEIARQISNFQPRSIILFDNAETPLYNIEMEVRKRFRNTLIIPFIGDIRNMKSMEHVFKKYHPSIVFHAAAYKHVPMMELAPLDAVNTNILGTYKIASLSCKYHVDKFVMISTDKAVRPTSIMGASKRVAEMVVQSMNGNGTRFVIVRFGNVLGSNGSVVPLFEKQIASGGPVTVTHPEVTRYFMTIPEAVMLVLQASAIGKGRELFLLDMGKPVKIADLAKNMIRLAGLVPEKDIKIEYIGLRPGEKLYEELLIAGEGVVDTAYNKIKVCKHSKTVSEEKLFEAIEHFMLLVDTSYDHEAAVNVIRSLIPAYDDSFNRGKHHKSNATFNQRDNVIVSYEA